MSSLIYKGTNLKGLLKKAKNMLFDNTESGLTATNVQDAIDEVNSNLAKNNLGTFVNLLAYDSSSNLYTFPEDGYVRVGGGTVEFHLYGADGANSYVFTKTEPSTYSSLFVKKGMKCYVDGTNVNALYVPIY